MKEVGLRMVISICIVNYNGRDFLPACIESVLASDFSGAVEIIVIDNGSTDGSIGLVRELFPDIELIESGRNEGFAAANNKAFGRSSGSFVLFLNPDTIVQEHSLGQMVSFLEAEEGAAACGCRLYHPESGLVESSARSDPDLLPLFWNLTYIDRLFPTSPFFSRYLMTHADDREARHTDWITGACMLVRSDVFEKVGGFDARFFMYCEDIDLCYRMRQAGWSVVYYPSAAIGHYRGMSSARHRGEGEGRLSVWGARQYSRSVLLFYALHCGKTKTLILRIMLIATSLIKAAGWITVGSLMRGWRIGSSRARSYCAMSAPAFERIALGRKGD
jgi:GT2 family glycosyltransferase